MLEHITVDRGRRVLLGAAGALIAAGLLGTVLLGYLRSSYGESINKILSVVGSGLRARAQEGGSP